MRIPLLCLVITLASGCFASVGISTTSLPNGTVNKSYSATVNATGGCAPYKWSVVSGTLPPGITAKTSSTSTSLVLSGIPSSVATYAPTLQVTACGGGTYKASYKIVIQAPSSVQISTATLPNGIVGQAYSAAVNAVGGCTPYKWSLVSGTLPAGITMKVSSTTTSLALSGTPSSASTYAPTVQVTGCGGATYKHSYSIAIQGTTNHVVDVSWKASTTSDVTGYNLYRSPDGVNWKKANVSLIASTMYNDATVANGSTYYYAATAVDIYGHESSKSASIKVSVP
jgi:large repetitive protein